MNRSFSILSIMSFLALVIYSLLMFFDVLSLIIHLKYIVVILSLFFTVLSLGLFLENSETRKVWFYFILILLILPVFISFMSLVSAEVYSNYWKVFIGGTVFQIGTGIFSLVGGFVKNGKSPTLKISTLVNYGLFLLLALVLFLDLKFLLNGLFLITVGGIVSLLSLVLVVLRKPV